MNLNKLQLTLASLTILLLVSDGCSKAKNDDVKPDYLITAKIGNRTLTVHQKDGSIRKSGFNGTGFYIAALTPRNQGLYFYFVNGEVTGKITFDSVYSTSSTSPYIRILSNELVSSSEFLTFGEMNIEELSQNPLIFNATFEGMAIEKQYLAIPDSYRYDTTFITNGYANVHF